MFKWIINLLIFALTTTSWCFAGCGSCFGDCCQSFEVGLGWRRDWLNWKLNDLGENVSCAKGIASHIEFEKLHIYTIHGKLRWVGEAYYLRLFAEYGRTEKGRAEECFRLSSPLLEYGSLSVGTNNHVKRRSEVYDFSGAFGHPFTFYRCRLNIIPLIGFSYHRQRLRVKEDDHCSCSSRFSVESDCSCSHSPFLFEISSDPFESRSSPNIASELGLSAPRDTSVYRFTWYGFYTGVDIAYALDPCWTIFTELELHFLDRCHRKRDSVTGVDFVDDYHRRDWAYGFNGTLGVNWVLGACWYANAGVDFKWWKSNGHDDHLKWESVGTNMALGYGF